MKVDAAEERHAKEEKKAAGRNPEFEIRVDAQGMLARRNDARQKEAAEAHPAHERAQKNAHRYGRRTNNQLQELEPDNFIDQRGTAAPHKQEQQRR